MDKILNDLNAVFKMLSTIPVTGESVEIMASSKNTLRQIYAEVKKKDEEIKSRGGEEAK